MEEDALASYLNALSRDDCYRVQSTLKSDLREVTELVYFIGSTGGELGPFIRKRISIDAGMGHAYRELLEVQKAGKRFLHLPRIYDVHERDDELIVIMEYVIGRTLHDEVYERDASLGLVTEFFPVLCDGVIELHEGLASPIIHRDLKPTNIIINKNGLTIIDFGIARSYHADAISDTTQFGTRAYAPPEQFGYGQTDTRSDVYALGMILYYMLREENPNPRMVSAGFPLVGSWPDLQMVIRKATAFDPASRYQSVRALKQAFIEAAEKERHKVQMASVSCRPETSVDVAMADESVDKLEDAFYPDGVQLTGAEASRAPMEPIAELDVVPEQLRKKASPSEIAGLIWDGFVALVWLFMMAAFVWAIVVPSDQGPAYPTWFLLAQYILFAGLLVTGVSYGVMDKRWLRRHIPFMRDQTFGRSWKVAGLMLLVSFVVLVILVIIVAVTGNFGYPSPS